MQPTAHPPLMSNQRRLRVEEYHAMIRAGIFDEDEPLELIEGILCTMSPQDVAHAQVIQLLTRVLVRTVPDSLLVRVQLPLTLENHSEPEPDIAVVTAEAGFAADGHPRHARLVIEVAGSSLDRDRQVKAPLYARAGIPEYWIVNLEARVVEIHRQVNAKQGRYRVATEVSSPDEAASTEIPEVAIPVGTILPPANR